MKFLFGVGELVLSFYCCCSWSWFNGSCCVIVLKVCDELLAYNDTTPMKRWILVNLCLTSRVVHLEMLHSYTAKSITRGFRRTFSLRGVPRITWIDAGLNIVKSGKDLTSTEVKVVSELNIKFAAIEFKPTLPKHHEGIGAVERVIGVIKNTASKAVTGPNQIQMDDEELRTWLCMITEKVNDRPLILGAPGTGGCVFAWEDPDFHEKS